MYEITPSAREDISEAARLLLSYFVMSGMPSYGSQDRSDQIAEMESLIERIIAVSVECVRDGLTDGAIYDG